MTCDTIGFFTRSVEDLELLGDVFQLSDISLVPSEPFQLNGARIAFCKSPIWPKAGLGTKKAFERARELLAGKGALVQDLELPDEFSKIQDWHKNILTGEGHSSFLGSKFSHLMFSVFLKVSHTRALGRLLACKGQTTWHD